MRRPISKHIIVSGGLIVGLIGSCIAMQAASNAGDRQLLRLYAVSSAILCIASSLSVFLYAARYAERKKQERKRERVVEDNHRDYNATYSLKDRVVFSVLTVGSASLSCLFYAHAGNYWVKILVSGMLVFCAVTAYRCYFTTVRFTDRLIMVEMKPLTKYSESYQSVTALRPQPGNLRIEFADGRILNLPAGLGNSARIASILEKRVKLPSDSGMPGA